MSFWFRLTTTTTVTSRTIIMLCVFFVGCTTTLPRRATAFTLPRRMQHASAALHDTLYSLNDKVCPPTEEHILRRVVEKHCHSLDLYLDQKPIARHTQEAFDIVKEFVSNNSTTKSTSTHSEGIILDRSVSCLSM